MATGTLRSFDPEKGIGSISPTDGTPDVTTHFNNSARAIDTSELEEGQEVEFSRERGHKGPEAINVRPA